MQIPKAKVKLFPFLKITQCEQTLNFEENRSYAEKVTLKLKKLMQIFRNSSNNYLASDLKKKKIFLQQAQRS